MWAQFREYIICGKEFIVKPFKFKNHSYVTAKIKEGAKLKIPETIRFREENGFWLMNIRWGNTIEITDSEAKFFIKKQKEKGVFTYKELKTKDSLLRLSNLVCKEAIVSDEIKIEVRKTGVNVDPSKLPNLDNRDEILSSHPDLSL